MREARGDEFYFVIRCDGAERGVFRLYDFREMDGRRSFCWGSFIMPAPRPPGLVTYTAVLAYELGFDVLGFDQAHFDVRKANTRMLEFHARMHATPCAEDELDYFFRYPRSAYAAFRAASARQIAEHRRPA